MSSITFAIIVVMERRPHRSASSRQRRALAPHCVRQTIANIDGNSFRTHLTPTTRLRNMSHFGTWKVFIEAGVSAQGKNLKPKHTLFWDRFCSSGSSNSYESLRMRGKSESCRENENVKKLVLLYQDEWANFDCSDMDDGHETHVLVCRGLFSRGRHWFFVGGVTKIFITF